MQAEAPGQVTIRGSAPRSAGRRRTKIVATIGPASRSVETMEALIEAGADVFRLNFSHGTRADHTENVAMAREAARAPARRSASSATCPGPKLRLGELAGGFATCERRPR